MIIAKRDGGRLTDEQIDWVIDAYTRGDVAEEQMSALVMAILLNGMDAAEIARWTAAMIDSGERLALGDVGPPAGRQALHRRGGGQDHAAARAAGRGVRGGGAAAVRARARAHRRHAGQAGVDPGLARGAHARRDRGAAGRGRRRDLRGRPELAPADRKLYALRDVTGTVESIPLIASSIMSKKIAEGTDALVLDVKVGSGAFMKRRERARELAETMVDLGAEDGGADDGAAHRHVRAAGPGGRQRAGGGRVGRGAARRRTGGRRRADARAGPGDARAGRAATSTRPRCSRPARRTRCGRAMVAAQGGDPAAPLPAASHVELVVRRPVPAC